MREVRDKRGRFARGNVPWNKKGPCAHHWIIDKNNVGICKKCGEVKDFGALLAKKAHKSASPPAEDSWNN